MNKEVQDGIKDAVKMMFQSLRLNLLGPQGIDKAYAFVLKDIKYDPQNTVTNMYLQANSINNPEIKDPSKLEDADTLVRIRVVAEQYISQLEEKTIADIQRLVASFYSEAELKSKITGESIEDILKSNEELIDNLTKQIQEVKEKVYNAVKVLVDHELHTAQNYGAMDGILEAAKASGIDDPTVAKIGVLDDVRCVHCWRLWTLEDKITPKVYKLSELSASPGHWKNPVASVSPTHPNCRDVLITIMPGFGFDASGKIVYKGIDPKTNKLWDEYSYQRGR